MRLTPLPAPCRRVNLKVVCVFQRGTIWKYSNREGYDFESYHIKLGEKLGFSR
jgi:hypothetical protein